MIVTARFRDGSSAVGPLWSCGPDIRQHSGDNKVMHGPAGVYIFQFNPPPGRGKTSFVENGGSGKNLTFWGPDLDLLTFFIRGLFSSQISWFYPHPPPTPLFLNNIFSPSTLKISLFSTFFHLFPLIFAFFLNKSLYLTPNNQYIKSKYGTKWKIYTPWVQIRIYWLFIRGLYSSQTSWFYPPAAPV